jgi:hypothetical protein
VGDAISDLAVQHAIVRMSNGATRTFLENLCLRVVELSASDWERGFALWLAEHLDVHRWGYSPTGFDVSEIAFSRNDFEAQRAFLVRVVDRAIADPSHGYELCVPSRNVVEALRALRSWLGDRFARDVSESAAGQWPVEPVEWRRFDEHGLCLTSLGCPCSDH